MATNNSTLLHKDVSALPDTQRFEIQLHWLKNLPSAIQTATKDELKGNRKSLVEQLLKLLHSAVPAALRLPLSESFIALFSSGDFSSILEVVNKCNDIIKSKDDAVSSKLAALQCVEMIFKHHGRMAGSCFLDVTQNLIRLWKSLEYRCNILDCFRSIIIGLGNSCSSMHKDMYKLLKQGLNDKQLPVRVAAAKCGIALSMDSSVYYTHELESLSQHCLKAFEGSSYDVRCSVALFLGTLLSMTQKPSSQPSQAKGKVKMASLDDCLSILYNGYIKTGGGFDILKGGGAASREVRIGVSQAYVFFLTEMGGVWLERHLPVVLSHFIDLLANPKAITTHVDAVYTRKCVGFIIQHTFSRLLGETAQLSACTHLCKLVLKCCQSQQSTHDVTTDSVVKEDKPSASGTNYLHSIVCSLTQISKLVLLLNTASLPLIIANDGNTVGGDSPAPLIKVFNKVLLHHSLAVRLSAAGTLYCIGLSLPSIITPLVDYLMKGLQVNRGNADGIVGYTNGLAALLSSSQFTELGIPSVKAMEIFKYGEEMVKTQFDGGKLSLANIQSGWALIGAYLSLGPSYVRVNLRNVIQLWHSVFPHSKQELMAETKTGSLSSWRHTLETRNGALTSIVVFTSLCQQLLSAEMCKRVMLPLDSALAMTTGLIEVIKTHGVQLKGQSAMLRLRLYQSFYHLPPSSYEGCLNTLLKEVVAEFTLADNLASTTTSLLRSLCHQEESTLLGSWLEETDHQTLEEMLQPNSAAGSGALEHDPASSYLYTNKGDMPTEPLPLGVAVIDASIKLFGRLFYQLSSKHQKQLLTHFKECIRQAKPANRQQAIQINIFTGFLAGLKGLVEKKGSLSNQDDIINTAYSLIPETLSSMDPMLRCAGSEALGRLSQVVGEAGFVGQIVQMAIDAIKTGKDSKMGYILSLGCLHRYVGGMGSGQHLQLSVVTLQQLAVDTKSSIGQVWSLHALTMIADSGGPLFRNHVDSTLTLLFNLLLTTPTVNIQMYRCLGKCLSALITTLGPELQMSSKSMNQMRERCLICCYIVQCHPDSVVKSSAISCLQQLQLFAPTYVSLDNEVPVLTDCLDSSHLLLRRSAANCLRQFCQQEPKSVWDIINHQGAESEEMKGLEKIVLAKLDIETDAKLRFDLKEILFSLVCGLSPNDPMKWLLLLNGVLSASGSSDKGDMGGASAGGMQEDQGKRDGGEEDDEEMAAKFTTGEDKQVHTNIAPRWQTKVFAVECSRKIYNVCKSNPGHFDLVIAQQKQSKEGGDFLVMHLAELVKTSFIAATATVDQLKLEGYKALQDVIRLFASTVDPDYPGHVLLEQYQAQIGAALRPAFTTDSAPHVTAIACQVCGEWLGSGVSRDISDLKRVQQLLVTSLDKVRHIGSSTSIYGDAVGTLESLAVLKAWAELYIKLSHEDSTHTDKLIAPHLPILDKYWILALQDHAYISLPAKFSSQLPSTGGTFYNNLIFDSVKTYYGRNWSSILHAAAISLSRQSQSKSEPVQGNVDAPAFASMVPINLGVGGAAMSNLTDERHSTFHVLMGIAVQSLCNSETFDNLHDVQCSLKAIDELVKSRLFKDLVLNEDQLIIELLELLHRILLTSTSPIVMQLTLDIAKTIGTSLTAYTSTQTPRNVKISKSLLVTAVYCLFLHVPDLSSRSTPAIPQEIKDNLICSSVCLLPLVTKLDPSPGDTLLPMMFHLILTTLPHVNQAGFTTVFQAFKSLCTLVPSDSTDILHSVLNTLTNDSKLSVQTRLLLSSVVLMSKEYMINHSDPLLKQWCAFAVSCLTKDTENFKLQLTALQVYDTLFQCGKPQLAFACVHEIVPEVLQLIQKWNNKSVATTSTAAGKGQSDVIIKATGVLEGLLKLTPTTKQSEMMALLVPLFISLLVSPTSGAKSSSDRMIVHSHVLNTLVSIGPLYPQAFKAVISSSPDLKARLEAAIKKDSNKQTTSTAGMGKVATSKPQQPAIKLKMDFSNFK